MLNDAVYYSRREKDERALAAQCSDGKVRQVHLLLARKYSELAQRELGAISFNEGSSGASVDADTVGALSRPAHR